VAQLWFLDDNDDNDDDGDDFGDNDERSIYLVAQEKISGECTRNCLFIS
jgi:hypothetical protein